MGGKRRGRPPVDEFLRGYSVRLREQTIDATNMQAKFADMEPRTWLRGVIERAVADEERQSGEDGPKSRERGAGK